MQEDISRARKEFEKLLAGLLAKEAKRKEGEDFTDYSELKPIIIGVAGGDGIGPFITGEARRVLEVLLREKLARGEIAFRDIRGLTLENRIAAGVTLPQDVLRDIKKCHVLLKGPTTTPRAGDGIHNIESANVAMRRELDLFANVRPVCVREEGIDWTFFRENTEGAYALGKQGLTVNEDIALDFTVTTTYGTERIARAACEYARKNNKKRVTAVTKANIIKTTDGKFLRICKEVAAQYPELAFDDWYIDIMTAKLIDKKRRSGFEVFILPNLYGDILTDLAAEVQGGVGTAGSANIGKKYAMFEAIHGSAPRMVAEGREAHADPSSMLRASVMLLSHIGLKKEAEILAETLDVCTREQQEDGAAGTETGPKGKMLTDRIISTIKSRRHA